MKNSPLTTMLLGAAAILVLAAVGLCWLYLRNTGELRAYQGQVQQLNGRQQIVAALVNDVMNYSQTHADIVPILESAGLTNRTTKPSAK